MVGASDGSAFKELSYEVLNDQNPAGFFPPGRLMYTVRSTAPWRMEYRFQNAPFWIRNPRAQFWQADATIFWVVGEFDEEWLVAGEFIPVIRQRMDVRLVTEPSRIQPRFRKLTTWIDVPDVTETVKNYFIIKDTGQIRCPPQQEVFRAIKNIDITIMNIPATTAVGVRVLDLNPTLGPLVEFIYFGEVTPAAFNYTLIGY